MSRSRTAFLSGTITDNPLTSGATTINSAGLASLPAISSPDIAVLVLDPTGSAGAPEVVYVTAHMGSATSATISRGQEGSSARQHASGVAWVHGPTLYDFKGWRLEASNSAEQTTTSTSVVDLVTISGLLIPVTQMVRISGNFRKTAGAAAYGAIGLKVNSTVVGEPSNNSIVNVLCHGVATDEIYTGAWEVLIPPRSTNYLMTSTGHYTTYRPASPTNGASTMTYPCQTADFPNAIITSIAIRAISGSASVTVAVKDVYVEVMDT